MLDAVCYSMVKVFELLEQLAFAFIAEMYKNPNQFFEKIYSLDHSNMSEVRNNLFFILNMFMTLEQKLDFLNCIERDKGDEYKREVKEFFTLKRNPRVEEV